MTSIFLLNLFLALIYVILTEDFGVLNFLIGYALGYVVLTLYCRATGRASYPGKFFRLLKFACYFLYILVKANLQVAWEIITPDFHMHPRIIRYPVSDLTEVQVTTLANAITLTPGTLTADVDEQSKYLYIHCMYGRDREQLIRDLDELKHRLIREVFES